MTASYADFEDHNLDDGHHFFVGRLPEPLRPDATGFEALWALHPDDFHVIPMPGGPVRTPRWQQAFGRDYHYTSRTNQALPVPPRLEPLLAWARRAIDDRLNGLLLNWYDGALGTRLPAEPPPAKAHFGLRRPGRHRIHHALRHEPGLEARGAETRPVPRSEELGGLAGLPALKWVPDGHRCRVERGSFRECYRGVQEALAQLP